MEEKREYDISPEATAMLKALHDQQADLTRRLEIVTEQKHVMGNITLTAVGAVVPRGTTYFIDFDNNKIIIDSIKEAKPDGSGEL